MKSLLERIRIACRWNVKPLIIFEIEFNTISKLACTCGQSISQTGRQTAICARAHTRTHTHTHTDLKNRFYWPKLVVLFALRELYSFNESLDLYYIVSIEIYLFFSITFRFWLFSNIIPLSTRISVAKTLDFVAWQGSVVRCVPDMIYLLYQLCRWWPCLYSNTAKANLVSRLWNLSGRYQHLDVCQYT